MDPGVPLRIRQMEEETGDGPESLFGSLARRVTNLRSLHRRMTRDCLDDYRELVTEERRIVDSLALAGKITEAQREKLQDMLLEPMNGERHS